MKLKSKKFTRVEKSQWQELKLEISYYMQAGNNKRRRDEKSFQIKIKNIFLLSFLYRMSDVMRFWLLMCLDIISYTTFYFLLIKLNIWETKNENVFRRESRILLYVSVIPSQTFEENTMRKKIKIQMYPSGITCVVVERYTEHTRWTEKTSMLYIVLAFVNKIFI